LRRSRILAALGVFGPAILVSVELFDPASIVAATAAGASVGLAVLWAAFYSGIMLIVIQEISARLGVVTGKTLAENIRERYGKNFSQILFIPSIFLDLSTLTAEVMGLSLAVSFFFKEPYAIAMIVSVLLTTVLFNIGSYSILEKIIMFLVTTIFLIYFYFLLYTNLPLSSIIVNSIVPSFSGGSFYYAEAIIGASIMPNSL
jgi:manganese transport protein